MSDNIETIPAPDAIKAAAEADRKAREARINARIAELTACAGKFYARNDGTGFPVQVVRYNGIAVKDGVAEYTFLAETRDARWTPPATKFLAEHHEIPAPAVNVTAEPI